MGRFAPSRIGGFSTLTVLAVISIYPFVWMVLTSLRDRNTDLHRPVHPRALQVRCLPGGMAGDELRSPPAQHRRHRRAVAARDHGPVDDGRLRLRQAALPVQADDLHPPAEHDGDAGDIARHPALPPGQAPRPARHDARADPRLRRLDVAVLDLPDACVLRHLAGRPDRSRTPRRRQRADDLPQGHAPARQGRRRHRRHPPVPRPVERVPLRQRAAPGPRQAPAAARRVQPRRRSSTRRGTCSPPR